MAVDVQEEGVRIRTGQPITQVEGGYFHGVGTLLGRTYDVSTDGERFLLIKAAGAVGGTTASQGHIVVVQNFDGALKRLLPDQ